MSSHAAVQFNELPIRIDRCHRMLDVPVGGKGYLNAPLPIDRFNQNMRRLNVRPYLDFICDLRERTAHLYPCLDCFLVRQVVFEQALLDLSHQ